MSDAHFIEPMPCLAVEKLPEGEAWEYELKLDGYRALVLKHDGRVTLFSRNRKKFNGRFPAIAEAFAELPDDTVIDGEIVAVDESGRPSFSRLQNFSANAHAITFYAFDIPMWKGEDMRTQPLDKRRDVTSHEGDAENAGNSFLRKLCRRRRQNDFSCQVARS